MNTIRHLQNFIQHSIKAHPIRCGMHQNSAFDGISFMLETLYAIELRSG